MNSFLWSKAQIQLESHYCAQQAHLDWLSVYSMQDPLLDKSIHDPLPTPPHRPPVTDTESSAAGKKFPGWFQLDFVGPSIRVLCFHRVSLCACAQCVHLGVHRSSSETELELFLFDDCRHRLEPC